MTPQIEELYEEINRIQDSQMSATDKAILIKDIRNKINYLLEQMCPF